MTDNWREFLRDTLELMLTHEVGRAEITFTMDKTRLVVEVDEREKASFIEVVNENAES